MAWIKRTWTAADADEWTKEDWLAIILSPIAYTLIMLGTAMSFLLLWQGFLCLLLGILATVALHWIIDPKLRSVSESYETQQKEYIRRLEQSVRWEDTDG